MSERPILFSGPLVRAILDGRKTVTRRVVNPQPNDEGLADDVEPIEYGYAWRDTEDGVWHCPYGVAAPTIWDADSNSMQMHRSRLYVREAFRLDLKYDSMSPREAEDWSAEYGNQWHVRYEVDQHHNRIDTLGGPDEFEAGRLRPSIHMLRTLSRIDLEVTEVRVERLQEITARDVAAEGVDLSDIEGEVPGIDFETLARALFTKLWDDINARRGFPFESNPWVWVVRFRRVRP